MPRGEFLKHSLLLLVGASCLLSQGRNPRAAGLGGEMAQGLGQPPPAGAIHPPLTEETLNQFIVVVSKGIPPDSEAIKTRATRDWRAVLREHFALTPLQKRALEVLPKETVQQVAQAISQAIRTHSGFVVRAIAAPEAGPPLEQPSGRTPSTADSDATRLAAWKKPDSIQCSKTDVTYECRVKAGVVC
jgi:hypothetical protein